jgi:hypothetical protein
MNASSTYQERGTNGLSGITRNLINYVPSESGSEKKL